MMEFFSIWPPFDFSVVHTTRFVAGAQPKAKPRQRMCCRGFLLSLRILGIEGGHTVVDVVAQDLEQRAQLAGFGLAEVQEAFGHKGEFVQGFVKSRLFPFEHELSPVNNYELASASKK
jgi:hypothetical protein